MRKYISTLSVVVYCFGQTAAAQSSNSNVVQEPLGLEAVTNACKDIFEDFGKLKDGDRGSDPSKTSQQTRRDWGALKALEHKLDSNSDNAYVQAPFGSQHILNALVARHPLRFGAGDFTKPFEDVVLGKISAKTCTSDTPAREQCRYPLDTRGSFSRNNTNAYRLRLSLMRMLQNAQKTTRGSQRAS